MFQITRIYSDAAGDSHFEVVQIPLSKAGPIGVYQTCCRQRAFSFGRWNLRMITTFITHHKSSTLFYWMAKLKLKLR